MSLPRCSFIAMSDNWSTNCPSTNLILSLAAACCAGSAGEDGGHHQSSSPNHSLQQDSPAGLISGSPAAHCSLLPLADTGASHCASRWRACERPRGPPSIAVCRNCHPAHDVRQGLLHGKPTLGDRQAPSDSLQVTSLLHQASSITSVQCQCLAHTKCTLAATTQHRALKFSFTCTGMQILGDARMCAH